MKNKILLKHSLITFLLIFFFQLISYKSIAQSKLVEMKEMKDTINQVVSKIKSLEKETAPGKKQIDDLRTRVMVLLILNSISECGAWPSPSSKIELIEDYWKCLFDKAPYGKKFILE